MLTFADFICGWHEYMLNNPEQRPGQALFNFAWKTNATQWIAASVCTTELDPFHDDSSVLDFLQLVERELTAA